MKVYQALHRRTGSLLTFSTTNPTLGGVRRAGADSRFKRGEVLSDRREVLVHVLHHSRHSRFHLVAGRSHVGLMVTLHLIEATAHFGNRWGGNVEVDRFGPGDVPVQIAAVPLARSTTAAANLV